MVEWSNTRAFQFDSQSCGGLGFDYTALPGFFPCLGGSWPPVPLALQKPDIISTGSMGI